MDWNKPQRCGRSINHHELVEEEVVMAARNRRKSRVTTTYRKSKLEVKIERFFRTIKRYAFWYGFIAGMVFMFWLMRS